MKDTAIHQPGANADPGIILLACCPEQAHQNQRGAPNDVESRGVPRPRKITTPFFLKFRAQRICSGLVLCGGSFESTGCEMVRAELKSSQDLLPK